MCLKNKHARDPAEQTSNCWPGRCQNRNLSFSHILFQAAERGKGRLRRFRAHADGENFNRLRISVFPHHIQPRSGMKHSNESIIDSPFLAFTRGYRLPAQDNSIYFILLNSGRYTQVVVLLIELQAPGMAGYCFCRAGCGRGGPEAQRKPWNLHVHGLQEYCVRGVK